jgi:hypothetical protein
VDWLEQLLLGLLGWLGRLGWLGYAGMQGMLPKMRDILSGKQMAI